MTWDTVIGLEVHAQLGTKSKLFSGASTCFGAEANTQTTFIDAGFPGTLPVLNKEAVRMAIQFGLAIEAEINDNSFFERKNYFYPDLPKGYQISQFQRPIIGKGHLDIESGEGQIKTVTIVRAHLEEDAGKSVHERADNLTGIDLNRAGTPLLEIVTAPCLFSAAEVLAYLKELRLLLLFLGICDGNMQEGSFRCDVNISIKPSGSDVLGTRVELKNLNSFRFIEKAIMYEQDRQQELLEQGLSVIQETRLYCPQSNRTKSMRSKEDENDYRYFPDPDLLPISIPAELLAELKSTLPPSPAMIRQNLRHEGVLDDDIRFLLSSPAAYHFYLDVRKETKADNKLLINWLKGTYTAALNEAGLSFEQIVVPARTLAILLDHVHDKQLNQLVAKQIFTELWTNKESIDRLLANALAQKQHDSSSLEAIVKQVISQYPEQVTAWLQGKDKLLAFFVGQVMKQAAGQANPEQVNELLRKQLQQLSAP